MRVNVCEYTKYFVCVNAKILKFGKEKWTFIKPFICGHLHKSMFSVYLQTYNHTCVDRRTSQTT